MIEVTLVDVTAAVSPVIIIMIREIRIAALLDSLIIVTGGAEAPAA